MFKLSRRFHLVGIVCLAFACAGDSPTPQDAAIEDPFLWLEEVRGEEALTWVETENARTVARLEAHPEFGAIYEEALADLTRTDRLTAPQVLGDDVYDLLQNAEHVRGLWRRTSFESFLSGDPAWEAVLDIDALGAKDGESWVFRGAICLLPEATRCMLTLSPGGSDAAVYREFDLEARDFPEDGFELPELKSSVGWYDEDMLLVAAASDDESSTLAGYGRKMVRWSRGTPFADAPVVLEVPKEHMTIQALQFPEGDDSVTLLADLVTILNRSISVLHGDGKVSPLPLPAGFDLAGVFDGAVYGVQKQPLEGGPEIALGSVVAFDLAALREGSTPGVEVLFEPEENQAVQVLLGTGTVMTDSEIYFAVTEDVVGRVIAASRDGDGWKTRVVPLPDNGAVTLLGSHSDSGTVIARYENLTTPPSLYALSSGEAPRVIESLTPKFDAEGLETLQHFAESADGTRVPYFVTKPKDLALDGSAPALLGAYGGFGIAITPTYMGSMVFGAGAPFKTITSRGGIYVLANIRGGGEYGPQWHQAGILKNRQRVFDDFHAVAEDLIERGYTSARRLGIAGASNSGLLVGVAMTQRPDLYTAVLCGVPLLDMLRYHLLLAGASWMSEYGDPDDPNDPEMREAIAKYSPYQNVLADKEYPEVMFWGSTKDDRVHPGHMRKMAARMQEQGHPFLYFEQTEGGHGSADLSQQARLEALQAVYLLERLTGD